MKNNKLVKISVVTICFQSENEIEQTINSVITQSYSNIEYIIIDGGSTDKTIDIIEKYKDRITYYLSEKDEGIYDAMNKGIMKASGEWILFMNSGDLFYSKDVISNIFISNSYRDYDILYGKTIFNYGNYSRIAVPCDIKNLKHRMCFCHQSCFVKTQIMKSNLFKKEYKIIADFVLFRTLFKNGNKFHEINEIISIFDKTNGISSGRSFKKIKQHNKELNQIGIKSSNIKSYIRFFIYLFITKLLPFSLWGWYYKMKKKY